MIPNKFTLTEQQLLADFPFFIVLGSHLKDYPVHNHDYNELYFILDGTAEHIINNQTFQIKAGDIFIVRNNIDYHEFKNPKNLILINIMYDPENMIVPDNALKQHPGYQALFIIEPKLRQNEIRSWLHVDGPEYLFLKNLFSEIEKEYLGTKALQREMICSMFHQLLITLSRLFEEVKIVGPQKRIHTIAAGISYIENNFLKEITLEEISNAALITPRHFNRIFKEAFHITPFEYLIEKRLEHACVMLREGNKPVFRIALESGFNDSNYFSRKFKQKYGETPKNYKVR